MNHTRMKKRYANIPVPGSKYQVSKKHAVLFSTPPIESNESETGRRVSSRRCVKFYDSVCTSTGHEREGWVELDVENTFACLFSVCRYLLYARTRP